MMPMKRTAVALGLLILLHFGAAHAEIYEYHFHESTGPNQAVMVNGEEVSIEFDKEKSEPLAFKSFGALIPGVLYPNSHGRIHLIGELDLKTKVFVLKDWYLLAPFTFWEMHDGPDIPTTKRIRTTLLRSDFVATNREFDPTQPGFRPADHVRREDGAKKP